MKDPKAYIQFLSSNRSSNATYKVKQISHGKRNSSQKVTYNDSKKCSVFCGKERFNT